MRLPSLLTFLATGLTLVSAAVVVSSPQEDCFTSGEVHCWQSGRTLYADKNTALEAITKACEKMKCTYGTAPAPGTVTGRTIHLPALHYLTLLSTPFSTHCSILSYGYTYILTRTPLTMYALPRLHPWFHRCPHRRQ